MQLVLRAAALALGVVVLVLGLTAAAPFALRERAANGQVSDTAAALPGQAQRATESLRKLGYSCSDVVSTANSTTRSCSRVNYLPASWVRMVLDTSTGSIRLAVATTDDEQRAARTYRQAVSALAPVIALPQKEQDKAVAAAGATADSITDLGWGTLTIKTVTPSSADESGATLRAAGSATVGLGASRTTLDVPVDALSDSAQAQGYTCDTPQVQTIRSCEKVDGNYYEELSFQGTDRYTTEVYLSVTSTYHRQTRSQWIRAMDQVMSWIDTDQTRAVRVWLAASQDAPGAYGYVGGLPISFVVRTDTRRRRSASSEPTAPPQSRTYPVATSDQLPRIDRADGLSCGARMPTVVRSTQADRRAERASRPSCGAAQDDPRAEHARRPFCGSSPSP
ncbi:hypothetical protein GCM10009593_38760 [Microlunatus antarcticus]